MGDRFDCHDRKRFAHVIRTHMRMILMVMVAWWPA